MVFQAAQHAWLFQSTVSNDANESHLTGDPEDAATFDEQELTQVGDVACMHVCVCAHSLTSTMM